MCYLKLSIEMFKRIHIGTFNKLTNPCLVVAEFKYKPNTESARKMLFEKRLEYFRKNLDREVFLTAGSKLKKNGEVIIAAPKPELALDSIFQEDPYYTENLGEYSVVKFGPTMCEHDFGKDTLSQQGINLSDLMILSLKYHKPLEATLEKIDAPAIQGAHVDFLKKHYNAGLFKISGRKQPRTGGLIVSENMSDQALQTVLSEDSFNKNKLTQYDIIRFSPGVFR